MFRFGKKKKDVKSFEEVLVEYLISHLGSKKSIQLLLPEVLGVLNIETDWKSVLAESDRKTRVDLTIHYWEKFAASFHTLIELFKDRLLSVDTVLIDEELYVIYTFKVTEGAIHYIGKIPSGYKDTDIVHQLPEELKSFYMNVHDGFVLVGLNDMGPLSTKDFYCIGDDLLQEEFIDGYSVRDSYMIFSNGSGDGIVYDMSQTQPKGFTYFHDDPTQNDFETNPIDAMCTWIEIAITE